MKNRHLREIRKSLEKRERARGEWPAKLGLANNVVLSTQRAGFVYARLYDNQAVEVWNSRVPPIYDLDVILGYSDNMPGIMQVLRTRYPVAYPPGVGVVTPHHESHEYPNSDSIWVYGPQIMPLNVLPGGSFTVTVFEGVLPFGGTWVRIASETLDLASYVPAAKAVYLLIQAAGDGTISVTAGAEVDGKENLTLEDIPASAAGCIGLAAVRLYAGQEAIRRDKSINDIVDLRWGMASSALESDPVFVAHPAYGLSAEDMTDIGNLSGTNTGDQDLSGYAEKSNVLELDNTTEFTPDGNYEPATKKYVDDHAGAGPYDSNPEALGTAGPGDAVEFARGNHVHAMPSHTELSDIGTNTHGQIDSHLGSTSNPHGVTAAQAGAVPNDGWVAASSGTWSYKSATEIYASGDWSGTQKGDRVKFVQTTTKFMVVTSVSAYDSGNDRTTLTVTGGTDYTVANAAISSPYWSRFPKPSGWPDSFNWTPTVSGSSGLSISSLNITTAKFMMVGGMCKFVVDFDFTTTGAGLYVAATTPATATDNTAFAANCRDGSSGALPVGTGTVTAANGLVFRKVDASNWSAGSTRRVYGAGEFLF